MPKSKKLKFFISYSHIDIKYKKDFLQQLKTLEVTHNIEVWHDGEILPGEKAKQEIIENLYASDVVLLFVSPNFLASDFCREIELKEAIQRHYEGKCIVIPVILSECEIDESLPFASLMRVPEDGKPIQKFHRYNDGYVNAVRRIKQMIDAKFEATRIPSAKEPIYPLSIMLYQDGEKKPYIIDDETWSTIQNLKEKLLIYQKIITEKMFDFIAQYKKEFSNAKKNANLEKYRYNKLKAFLLEISLTTREWLFKDAGVRVHFRILNKNKDQFVGFVVVDGDAKKSANVNWAKRLTPMSTSSGMIYYSGEFEAPLIKSKNELLHIKGTHDSIYVDYITSAFKFKSMCTIANPIMSMGISIEKDFNKQYASYLVALTFLNFDVIVENSIILLCREIKKIDKGFELTNII